MIFTACYNENRIRIRSGYPTVNTLTQQGIAAYKAGKKADAQRLLRQALQQDANDIPAWLCLAGAVDNAADQAYCFQMVLRLDPNNAIARNGMAKVEQDQQRAAREAAGLPEVEPPQPDFRAELLHAAPFTTNIAEESPSQPQPLWEESTAWPDEEKHPPVLEETGAPFLENSPEAAPESDQPTHAHTTDHAYAARKSPHRQASVIESLARKTAFKPWMWLALGGMALLICIALVALFAMISGGV